jgi:hypothetical protein
MSKSVEQRDLPVHREWTKENEENFQMKYKMGKKLYFI